MGMAWDHWNVTPPSPAPVNGDVSADVLSTGKLREDRTVSIWERADKWERRLKPVLWLLTIVFVGFTTYVAPRAEGWAQDIADKAAKKAIEAHEANGPHEGSATKKDLEGIALILTKMDKKLDGIVHDANEAAKDRAAVLCKAIKKTEIKGDLCVLKKIKGRPKKTIPLFDHKALRAEVYGE